MSRRMRRTGGDRGACLKHEAGQGARRQCPCFIAAGPICSGHEWVGFRVKTLRTIHRESSDDGRLNTANHVDVGKKGTA